MNYVRNSFRIPLAFIWTKNDSNKIMFFNFFSQEEPCFPLFVFQSC